MIGVVIGGAAWVEFVGSVDMWTRFRSIGIPATATVAQLPKDLLFAVGVRTLVVPVLIGLVAFTALLLWPRRQTAPTTRRGGVTRHLAATATEGSPAEYQPRGLKTILTVLGVSTVWFVLDRPLDGRWTAVLLVAAGTALVLVYVVVVRTDGFASVAATLFVAVSVFGALVGLARSTGSRSCWTWRWS